MGNEVRAKIKKPSHIITGKFSAVQICHIHKTSRNLQRRAFCHGIRNQESGIRNQESGIRNQVDFGISSFLCQVVCGLDLHFFQSFSHFAVLSPSRRFDMLCQRRYNGFRNRVCRNEANMGNNDITKIISNPSIYEKSTVDIKPAGILQQHRSLSRSGFVQRHSRCLGKRQLGCLLPK